MSKRLMAALCAGCLVSACVATPPLREIAVDTNRLVADTANDQTMLNILRAMDRMPMHFTSFNVLRGNLSVSGSASLGMGLPDDGFVRAIDAMGNVTSATRTRGVNTVSPSVSATVAANPSFDLQVYDTKQFQSGILTPLSESLMEYYLQRGWSEDLLTALFIARVDVTFEGAAAPVTIANTPDSEAFAGLLKVMTMARKVKPGSVSPLIPLGQFNQGLSLADVALLDGSKYDVVTDPAGLPRGQYIARKRAPSVGVTWSFSGQVAAADANFSALNLAEGSTVVCTESDASEDVEASLILGCTSSGAKFSLNIQFRSPEGILSFLGAYAGCVLRQDGPGESCEPYRLPDGSQVIVVDRGSRSGSLLAVQHRNATFSMPAPEFANGVPDHRGSEAITIAQQLVNLHKSADTLPVSSSIQLVN